MDECRTVGLPTLDQSEWKCTASFPQCYRGHTEQSASLASRSVVGIAKMRKKGGTALVDLRFEMTVVRELGTSAGYVCHVISTPSQSHHDSTASHDHHRQFVQESHHPCILTSVLS